MSECEYNFHGVEETVLQTFSNRLKKVRMSAKLKQQQFANIMGISVAALSYYETGKRTPDIVFLYKLSEYFMIPVDYFLGRTESTKPENADISRKLGLSDEAIEKLQEFTNIPMGGSEVLKSLLECDEFYHTLFLLTCCAYEPDDDYDMDYLNFIATKKMMEVISSVINNKQRVDKTILKELLPHEKKRLKFIEWFLEQNEIDHQELMKRYEARKKQQEEKWRAKIAEYNNSQTLRTTAIQNIKEAENNGKHNPQTE